MKYKITDEDIKWFEMLNEKYPRKEKHELTIMIEKLALSIKELQEEQLQ